MDDVGSPRTVNVLKVAMSNEGKPNPPIKRLGPDQNEGEISTTFKSNGSEPWMMWEARQHT